MADALTLHFLGTGTSHGIPVVGCSCQVCQSTNSSNQRYRPAVVIEWRGKVILIDTPPELRLQLHRARISHVDALLITHTHADHIYGLDDVRIFNQRTGKALPVYASASSLTSIRQQFPYIFVETPIAGGKPQLDLIPIEPIDCIIHVAGLPIQPVPVWHGTTRVLGYRFGDVAYVTDTNNIPTESLGLLSNLDVLVLDALRDKPHPTHFSIDEALDVVRELRPRQTYFTHICHEIEHETTNRRLPVGVQLAYDGLTVVSRERSSSP